MSQPIVVTTPHQLKALRRLQRRFSDAGSNPGGKFFVFKNRCSSWPSLLPTGFWRLES